MTTTDNNTTSVSTPTSVSTSTKATAHNTSSSADTDLTVLNIATRQSPLALWQAEHIKARLLALYPKLEVNLVKMVTKGDKILDTPLAKIGGKGLFVKELEQAMYERRADIAVHSLKDVPMVLPQGLVLGAYCTRAAPTDAFVSNQYQHLDQLPQGAVVGTSSLRRQCQLKAYRPDLQIKTLRGNVGTRLSKLDAGEYDAIILATSGLQRIGLDKRICSELDINISLPAVGQGALAIECRADDDAVLSLIKPLNDDKARLTLMAERALNRYLEGGCQVPIAAFAVLKDAPDDNNHHQGAQLWLRGRVGSPDGTTLLKSEKTVELIKRHTANVQQQNVQQQNEKAAEALGIAVAQDLLDKGAKQILHAVYNQ